VGIVLNHDNSEETRKIYQESRSTTQMEASSTDSDFPSYINSDKAVNYPRQLEPRRPAGHHPQQATNHAE